MGDLKQKEPLKKKIPYEESSTRDNRDEDRDPIENKLEDFEATLLHNNVTSSSKATKSRKNDKKYEKFEADCTMTEDINKLLRDTPLTKDTTCGFWIMKGSFLQRFANQSAYVIIYGLVGCVFSMTDAYFNGTITTIEKRFKIPSKNTGIISAGYDISQILVSGVLSYYAGKGHRPRWIGFGLLTIVAFCLLNAAPHFLYGPGEDALSYTVEFGAMPDENATFEVLEEQRTKTLCRLKGSATVCEKDDGNFTPQLLLFLANFISGIGGSIYYALGISYMDDNTKKSKTPALLSLSFFLRMLGPAIGYTLASFCLRAYIAPQLKPVINSEDPRWLGAWWMGWLILGGLLFFSGVFLTMFPKELPRAVARRMVEEDRRKHRQIWLEKERLFDEISVPEETKASLKDMLKTFKRLTTNKTLMCNNLSSVFYFFGYTPYWIFTPKYIEIQYRQSAATSSMVTGTFTLVFSAVGVLLAGFVITKYKPRARYMAAWNVIVGFLSVAGMIAYAFIGCSGNEKSVIVNIPDSNSLTAVPTCNSNCHCDYVQYSPVCGENNMTYISPCHAGCKMQHMGENGKKIYYQCACIPSNNNTLVPTRAFEHLSDMKMISDHFDSSNSSALESTLATTLPASLDLEYLDILPGGQAISGACPVDCFAQFVTFLAVMCCLKFIGAAGRASNFLVSVRCVSEKDKTASIGLNMMMMSLLAFIPSPIFFGWLIDSLCVVWGKTCTNTGNCWLNDPESLRYILNITASAFVTIGSVFDIGVWYYVKDLKIFDEEIQETETENVQHEEEVKAEKKTLIL